MADYPPARPAAPDRGARTGAWHLAVPPAVFLVHFGAVYGWTGLACGLGWAAQRWGGVGLVHIGVLLLTAAALAVLWSTRPPAEPEAPDEIENPYDPAERRHFVATTSRMLVWLVTAATVMVALSSVFARICAGGL